MEQATAHQSQAHHLIRCGAETRNWNGEQDLLLIHRANAALF
jgi:hypothetical protein